MESYKTTFLTRLNLKKRKILDIQNSQEEGFHQTKEFSRIILDLLLLRDFTKLKRKDLLQFLEILYDLHLFVLTPSANTRFFSLNMLLLPLINYFFYKFLILTDQTKHQRLVDYCKFNLGKIIPFSK